MPDRGLDSSSVRGRRNALMQPYTVIVGAGKQAIYPQNGGVGDIESRAMSKATGRPAPPMRTGKGWLSERQSPGRAGEQKLRPAIREFPPAPSGRRGGGAARTCRLLRCER